MNETPRISPASETTRHLHQVREDIHDIWRHEGLKRVAEAGLHYLGENPIGRKVLDRLSDGAPIDPRLATSLGDLVLASPVGVGAGWDKSGRSILGLQSLGADYVAVGGVTYYPQAGNRMPRLRSMDRMLGDRGTAVSLNSYGFYSPGVDQVVHNVARQRETGALKIPVELQITLNKEFYEADRRKMIPEMIASTIAKALPVADVIGLGMTSPNTLGMRDAQNEYEFIRECVTAAREATLTSDRRVPLAYKGDGDGGERRLEMYCRLVRETDIDIIQLINSTALPHIKRRYGVEHLPGGLAGADEEYHDMALRAVYRVREALGTQIAIDGMGGINSPERAIAMLEAGADKISIVSSIQQNRRHAFTQLKRGILEELDNRPEIPSVRELTGCNRSLSES